MAVHMETWGSRPGTAANGGWTLAMVSAKTRVTVLWDGGVPLGKLYLY